MTHVINNTPPTVCCCNFFVLPIFTAVIELNICNGGMALVILTITSMSIIVVQ
jgi:hypothetical protein